MTSKLSQRSATRAGRYCREIVDGDKERDRGEGFEAMDY